MNLAQALAYFVREATINLLRGWKVSSLAILTIAVSLFLGGLFLLVAGNLATVVESWRTESKIAIYLAPDSDEEARDGLRRRLAEGKWVEELEEINADEARRRFATSFPSLADLLEGWEDDPLPPSIEIRVDGAAARDPELAAWLETLRDEPAVAMIDDDRDWLAQLETVILVLRGLGVVLGSILLATAMFTIASVIRLTAYLYRDEIAVMRMVGATEFFIRGPFYVEGVLQGLGGGLLATAALTAAHLALERRAADTVLATILTGDALGAGTLAVLIALGGAAGLIGAVASLRREALGRAESGE